MIECAQSRYDKKNRILVAVMLNRKTEPELVAWMDKVDNKQGYIKGLIRADMARSPEEIAETVK